MGNGNDELVVVRFSDLQKMIDQSIERHFKPKANSYLEIEKLTKHQAAILAGISLPTLNKLIRNGKFKQYSLGRKKYLLRSEVIESLRK